VDQDVVVLIDVGAGQEPVQQFVAGPTLRVDVPVPGPGSQDVRSEGE
jgi:hypothetical protein